jgi:hypothetical protein
MQREKERQMKRIFALVAVLTTGCASIVHQTTQQIPVASNPPGAAVTVACGDVNNDPKLLTPTVVTVHRKPKLCAISLTKDGYQSAEVALARKMSGWYLGNILFGGIIGLIVDAANGAMYDRTPPKVDVTLVQSGQK